MSIPALNWAFALPIRDMRIKGVLLALANHHNERTGLCCPSLSRIALGAGCSEQTVRRTLKAMLGMGLLAEVERGKGRSAHYEIDFTWDVDKTVERGGSYQNTPDSLEAAPLTDCNPDPLQTDRNPLQTVTLIIEPHDNLHENQGVCPKGEGWKTIERALAALPRRMP